VNLPLPPLRSSSRVTKVGSHCSSKWVLALYLCSSSVPYPYLRPLDLSAASESPYMLMKNNAHAPHPEVEVANMYLSPTFFGFRFNSPCFTSSNRQVLVALVTSALPPPPANAQTFLMVLMIFPRRGVENLVHHFVSTRRVASSSLSSPFVKCSLNQIMSMGRGGAGNIRSPSQDVVSARPGELSSISETEQIEYEKSLIRNREVAREGQMVCPPA
jgi:hypothetical protein